MDDTARSPLDTITFAQGTRDRADHLRGDADRMAAMAAAPGAGILPLWRGKPLLEETGEVLSLGWLAPGHPVLAAAGAEPPLFLGLEGDSGRFAVDISSWEPADPQIEGGIFDPTVQHHPDLPAHFAFADLRASMARMGPQDAADAATARAMQEWHRSHRFCSRCGAPSAVENAGWRRGCGACGGQHFPRTDPVVIQLIIRGDKALLGRQPSWPPAMWSLLAGFVEPGESFEAAVRRETMEEAGIAVGRVRYLCSQPWPFPNSLMVACLGEALDERIVMDENELEGARWVSRLEVLDALAGNNPDFRPGREGAVAHSVLKAWAEGWTEPF